MWFECCPSVYVRLNHPLIFLFSPLLFWILFSSVVWIHYFCNIFFFLNFLILRAKRLERKGGKKSHNNKQIRPTGPPPITCAAPGSYDGALTPQPWFYFSFHIHLFSLFFFLLSILFPFSSFLKSAFSFLNSSSSNSCLFSFLQY